MNWQGLVWMAIGGMLTWVGWRHWRYRNEETISALEASFIGDEEPLPRTALDKFLTIAQAVAGLTLGPVFVIGGLAALFV